MAKHQLLLFQLKKRVISSKWVATGHVPEQCNAMQCNISIPTSDNSVPSSGLGESIGGTATAAQASLGNLSSCDAGSAGRSARPKRSARISWPSIQRVLRIRMASRPWSAAAARRGGEIRPAKPFRHRWPDPDSSASGSRRPHMGRGRPRVLGIVRPELAHCTAIAYWMLRHFCAVRLGTGARGFAVVQLLRKNER